MNRGTVSCAAFVLHQRAYRETSALMELFTEAEGRISVVARGVRTHSRRGAGKSLSAFRLYNVEWAGQHDLTSLRRHEPLAAAHPLKADALYAGLYANELLLRLCARGDPHPMIFTAYQKLLISLAAWPELVDVSLRYFERDLLTDLGYGLNLTTDAQGQAVFADGRYVYEAERGAVAVNGQERPAEVSGMTLLALEAGTLEGQQMRRQARYLLRGVMKPLLGEKPLKSLDTLRRMRALQGRESSRPSNEGSQ